LQTSQPRTGAVARDKKAKVRDLAAPDDRVKRGSGHLREVIRTKRFEDHHTGPS